MKDKKLMKPSEKHSLTTADTIIVGAGSAGSVLASRLSEDPGCRVLLLESGPDTPPGREPWHVRDTYLSSFYHPENFWPDLRASFSPYTAGPPRRYEQARIMGGGSSINAMIALRGMPGDFEEWVAGGADGWAWSDVLPYFRMIEHDYDFDGPLHGKEGKIPVRRHRRDEWPGFCQAVAAAAERRGLSFVADMNGEVENGYCAVPISSTLEQRISAAMAYLGPAVRTRKNLAIRTDTTVESLLFEGAQVVGVSVRRNGNTETYCARRVIVAAGALHTPALLQRAGIGPGEALRNLGISVVANRPGVGANLQDHPCVSIACYLEPGARQPRTLKPHANLALRYDSDHPGCATSDIYISVTNKTSWHALGRALAALTVCIYKPYSRGFVMIDSQDFKEPKIDFNLLSDQRDLLRLVDGMSFAHELCGDREVRAAVKEFFPSSYTERIRQLNRYSSKNRLRAYAGLALLEGPSSLRRWLLKNVISPGISLEQLFQSRATLGEWVRSRAVPFYHPIGTCRMGRPHDPMAVTSSRGEVYGVSGLFVADASLMPTIPRANTNLTTMMIAEKIAAQLQTM